MILQLAISPAPKAGKTKLYIFAFKHYILMLFLIHISIYIDISIAIFYLESNCCFLICTYCLILLGFTY